MKKFLPVPSLLGSVVDYLRAFVPDVERELVRIEKKIPDKAPTTEEIRDALLNDPAFKDAIYQHIKNREGKENA